jgi:hypothetical protein
MMKISQISAFLALRRGSTLKLSGNGHPRFQTDLLRKTLRSGPCARTAVGRAASEPIPWIRLALDAAAHLLESFSFGWSPVLIDGTTLDRPRYRAISISGEWLRL